MMAGWALRGHIHIPDPAIRNHPHGMGRRRPNKLPVTDPGRGRPLLRLQSVSFMAMMGFGELAAAPAPTSRHSWQEACGSRCITYTVPRHMDTAAAPVLDLEILLFFSSFLSALLSIYTITYYQLKGPKNYIVYIMENFQCYSRKNFFVLVYWHQGKPTCSFAPACPNVPDATFTIR